MTDKHTPTVSFTIKHYNHCIKIIVWAVNPVFDYFFLIKIRSFHNPKLWKKIRTQIVWKSFSSEIHHRDFISGNGYGMYTNMGSDKILQHHGLGGECGWNRVGSNCNKDCRRKIQKCRRKMKKENQKRQFWFLPKASLRESEDSNFKTPRNW